MIPLFRLIVKDGQISVHKLFYSFEVSIYGSELSELQTSLLFRLLTHKSTLFCCIYVSYDLPEVLFGIAILLLSSDSKGRPAHR